MKLKRGAKVQFPKSVLGRSCVRVVLRLYKTHAELGYVEQVGDGYSVYANNTPLVWAEQYYSRRRELRQ